MLNDEQKLETKIASTDPMYAVQYLMFLKGRYWYLTDCCDVNDRHDGMLVTSTEVPNLGCPSMPLTLEDPYRPIVAEVSLVGDLRWKMKATLIEDCPIDETIIVSDGVRLSIEADSIYLEDNSDEGERIRGNFQIARIVVERNASSFLFAYPTAIQSQSTENVTVVSTSGFRMQPDRKGYVYIVNVGRFADEIIHLTTR